MTGRWSCVLLLLGLAACRTPHKNVSAYMLDDDESSATRHLRAGSDIGETVTGHMNLPNYADTETATNSAVATGLRPLSTAAPAEAAGSSPAPAPATLRSIPGDLQTSEVRRLGGATNTIPRFDQAPGFENIQPGRTEFSTRPHVEFPGEPPLPAETNRLHQRLEIGSALPAKTATPMESLHLQPGNRSLPDRSSPPPAQFDLSTNRRPASGVPGSPAIHLSLPVWANSAPRETTPLADLDTGRTAAGASRPAFASVTLPRGEPGASSGAAGLERPVVIPAVGRGATSMVEAVTQPVDLAPLLAVTHDADWRLHQADRQRAAETARQAERDSLEKSLQQFLQPAAK